MGCKPLPNNFFYPLEIIHSKKSACAEKKRINYYPFGLKHKGYNNVISSNGNSVANRFGYNGKEHNEELGLDWIDFGWRNHDAALGRWMNIDPLAEDYLSFSTYNYTVNDPVRNIDPDGRGVSDVILQGDEKDLAFSELQASVEGQLTLTMDDNGKVTATQVEGTELSIGARDLLNATTDSNVIVTVTASNNDKASNGDPLLGNQMGAVVNADGTVDAKQEINPEALSKMDIINNKAGQTTLHEVTEGYRVGAIAQASGVSVAPPTIADADNPNSIYSISHGNVVPQSGEIGTYDQNARPIINPSRGRASTTTSVIYGTRPHGSSKNFKPFH